MKSRVVAAAFVVLCLLQVAAVSSMVVRYERTLRSGTQYKIRVEPVDPADAFRGRYVAIRPLLVAPASIVENNGPVRERFSSWRQEVFVTLETDADGFAMVKEAFDDQPSSGDYLTARSEGERWEPPDPEHPEAMKSSGYNLSVPFDRYYMNETAAPQAESAYREAARDREQTRAWIVVRVRGGLGAVEGLFIDGVPIEDVVAGRKATGAPTSR